MGGELDPLVVPGTIGPGDAVVSVGDALGLATGLLTQSIMQGKVSCKSDAVVISVIVIRGDGVKDSENSVAANALIAVQPDSTKKPIKKLSFDINVEFLPRVKKFLKSTYRNQIKKSSLR